MKKVLITGSTKGIGKQLGTALLHQGHFVYFNYCHDSRAASKIDYINSSVIQADMSTIKGIDILEEQIDALDYLVCNIGISDRTPFKKIEVSKWQQVIDTNLTIPFFLIQRFADKIKPNGKILFIGSVLGKVPDASSISYGVTKGALSILTQYLAKEFASKGITVNTIAPGFINTEWHKGKSQDQIERIKNKIALRRFGETSEVTQLCLAVLANEYLTGQTIYIDGGYNLSC